MEEKYFDAYSDLITEGFYRSRDSGGLFYIKKGENGEFILIDTAVPGKEFSPSQHITSKLAPITNPQYEVKSLRNDADWLEGQLEKLIKESSKE